MSLTGTIVLLMLLISLSLQQKDPLKDFCRRFGHQTAVIHRKLFIDGGLVNWNPIREDRDSYPNTWLLYQDLDTSPAGVEVPQLYANLSKNSSIPSVSGGILWQDDVNKRFYLYGGENSGISPNSPNMLAYDTLDDKWDSVGPPDKPIQRVSYGGGTAISSIGHGYMLGGWLSNASVPGWSGSRLATNSLIKYDMNTNDWSNNTGPSDNVPRAEGVMVYVPASDDGLLVYFGGVTAPFNNGTMIEAPMSLIHIYDIRSSKWYTQTADGDVPLARRRFCAGAVWAPDQSSYNIYLYGGLGFGPNATGFDDVYILSLPSFNWIRWWESSDGGRPHNSLSCNVVGNSQMLIIGGTFPLDDACDQPVTWATHNLDLGKQSGRMWNGYDPNITSYVVPPEVLAVVGGSSVGGAAATAPASGYNNGDLAVYFKQKATVATRTPTRVIPTATKSASSEKLKSLSTGAIAGIAVGGAVLLIALILGIYCFARRKRRRQRSQNPSFSQSQAAMASSSPQSVRQYPATPHYQLPANAPPAELSDNNYPLNQVDPKTNVYHQVQDSPHDIYPSPTQRLSPSISPHPSQFSGGTGYSDSNAHTLYESQVSPTPTYSSAGRPRRPIPPNETYYST